MCFFYLFIAFITEWWGAGMVVCLEQGAHLHMAQLIPLPLTFSCFSKIQIGFSFLVLAHPDKGPLNRRVCVCILVFFLLQFNAVGLLNGLPVSYIVMHLVFLITSYSIQSVFAVFLQYWIHISELLRH